jgi:hypothetical protein
MFGKSLAIARKAMRPIRPNPLMPTLIVIRLLLCLDWESQPEGGNLWALPPGFPAAVPWFRI